MKTRKKYFPPAFLSASGMFKALPRNAASLHLHRNQTTTVSNADNLLHNDTGGLNRLMIYCNHVEEIHKMNYKR